MPDQPTRTAIVTGASRGIGKAIAVALAADGFDVAITARTVHEGTATAGGHHLPGSLDTTAAEIEAHGRRAVPIALDLLDRDRLMPAAAEAVAALGHVDVLVNNAVYVGPGNHTRFLDTDWVDVERRLYANLTAQLAFTRPVLAAMVERGSGLILDVASGAGRYRPPAPPGEGGWGLAYSASKAGFRRMAVQLAVEYGDAGIRILDLHPGMVVTERVAATRGPVAHIAEAGVPPEVIGAATVAVVNAPEGTYENGSWVEAQDVARDLGLLQS